MSQFDKYLKYQIIYNDVYQVLSNGGYKDIVIHIDIAGISKGFYSKSTIKFEVGSYAATQTMPTTFLVELQSYLKLLSNKFAGYNPRFVLFYDNGQCKQNVSVSNLYKADRRASSAEQRFMVEEAEMAIFKLLKAYYYETMLEKFQIPGVCTVIDLEDYESDLVPHLMVSHGLLGCDNPSTLNLVLALDKDLVQTCRYNNVRMAASIYYKAKRKLDMQLLDNDTGLKYLYSKFLRGILTTAHLPIVLSLSGDKADNIAGIRGIGYAKAIALCTQYFRDTTVLDKNTIWPAELEPHKRMLLDNFKMIDFDSQITRLPDSIMNSVKSICRL